MNRPYNDTDKVTKKVTAPVPLWQPRDPAATQLADFIAAVAATTPAVHDYDTLYQWSITARAEFWAAIWRYCGVVSSQPWAEVLCDGEAMPGARWFTGARLNFAENLLRYRDAHPAILFATESPTQAPRHLTYAELYGDVARTVALLRDLGVARGDRVAGYIHNGPEAIIAMLATAAVGAIWSACSPDFGVAGVLSRFTQITPKILFATAGYTYQSQYYDQRAAIARITEALPSVEMVVVVAAPEDSATPPDLSGLVHAMHWCARPQAAAVTESIDFAQLPFDHPLYILYSSGTTGQPKCIVHGAGGTLLQHLKEHRLHTDLRRTDRLFYFTTCGWMMWNWLASGLATGCTLILYDGAPMAPTPERLWILAEQLGVTVFGTSAGYLGACNKAKLRPRDAFDLAPLRMLLSTGAPLLAEHFDYVYADIKPTVHLASISGGTDIVSCFVLGNPMRPVYRGEIQGPGLGMAVTVYDATHPTARRATRGELVCERAFPNMPLGFWGEDGHRRYHQAYFARFAQVWTQGDDAAVTAHDGMIIYGRSDAVLNPGGVRIGTAEIYQQVAKIDEILESVCIGQHWEGDERIVLFVQLRATAVLDAALAARIRATIRAHTSPRHAPKKIIAVTAIPKTRSGKIVELAVRAVVHGQPVANTEALANPEALEYFRDRPELVA